MNKKRRNKNKTIFIMKSIYKLTLLISCLFIAVSCKKKPIDVYDDFEVSSLKNIWSTDRMEARSFEIQSQVTRKGKSAAKITLRTGDIIEAGNDSSLTSERDELEEINSLLSVNDVTYEYQFSMFLPDSFPIVPTRLIIAQWKEKCPGGYCSDDSPVLAIRYRSGKLFITLNTDSGRHKLFETNEEIRNRWLDFKFKIKFSQQADGKVIAFLNDKNIIDYKGITSYSEIRGYHSKNNRYYFKMGLYRDRMPEPMWIYIDEYRKKEIK